MYTLKSPLSERTLSAEVLKSCKGFISRHSNIVYFSAMEMCTPEFSGVVSVGDCVKIASFYRSDSVNADAVFVATIHLFFDIGDDLDQTTKRAVVKWFYAQHEIPAKKRPSNCFENEVFMSTSATLDVIDAESISGTCTVSLLQGNSPPVERPNRFFYRRKFDGRKVFELNGTCQTPTTTAKVNRPPTGSWEFPTPLRSRNNDASCAGNTTTPRRRPTASTVARAVNGPEVTHVRSGSEKYGNRVNGDTELYDRDDRGKSRSDVDYVMTKGKHCSLVGSAHVRKLDANAAALDLLAGDDDDGDLELATSQVTSSCRKIQTFTRPDDVITPHKLPSSDRRAAFGGKTASVKKKVGYIDLQTTDVMRQKVASRTMTSDDRNVMTSMQRTPRTKKTPLRFSPTPTVPDTPTSGRRKPPTKNSVAPSSINEIGGRSKARKSLRLSMKSEGFYNDNEDNFSDDVDGNYDADDVISSSDDDFALADDDRKTPVRPMRSLGRAKRMTSQSKGKIATPLRTPKNRKAYIPDRKTPLRPLPSGGGVFDQARERLHVAAVPDSLPCREDKFHSIYSFVESKMASGTGGCMYISGVPGTGKTATVMEVVAALRRSVDDGMLDDFNYVEINGMRLTEPHQAYVNILQQLRKEKATPAHAAHLLTQHFSQRGRNTTLLLVDELDLLWTRKQDVLYHLFDWPTHRHARLIVIAIANTMDLPERIMMNRVSSRLGMSRLSFLPYNYKQLQEIVASRLRGIPGSGVFAADATQLVARKVAAVSGDARRCLDICRRAIDIAAASRLRQKSKSEPELASVGDVHQALQEMFSSPMISFISSCSEHEKLVLRAIVSEFQRSGVEECTIQQLVTLHRTLARLDGLHPLTVTSLMHVCNNLSASRVLLVESARRHHVHASRVRLNVSVDDVMFALSSDNHS